MPQKPVSRKFTISGYVTDGGLRDADCANILESRRSTGTATNPFGFIPSPCRKGKRNWFSPTWTAKAGHSWFELTKDTFTQRQAGQQ